MDLCTPPTSPPPLKLVHGKTGAGAARPRGDADRPTVVHAVGARSSFVRVGPVIAELQRRRVFRQVVVDLCPPDTRPSPEALDEIGFPQPDRVIAPGEGGRGERTARMLAAFERALLDERPALVMLAGDFDATLACALAAAKLRIPVAHIEAGLRDWDWGSPAEINRVLTDQLSDALFCHGAAAADNLRAEGVADGRIHQVGSTVVDWLRGASAAARRSAVRQALGVAAHEYVLVALHKRATVDGPGRAARLSEGLSRLGEHAALLLPSPTRTTEALAGLPASVRRLGPLSFCDFVALAGEAGAIVTDSGSVQEEASALGVPCYTLRATTERQVTLTHGTNTLLDDPADLAFVRPSGRPPTPCAIPMWDGHAGARVAEALIANFALRSDTAAPRGGSRSGP